MMCVLIFPQGTPTPGLLLPLQAWCLLISHLPSVLPYGMETLRVGFSVLLHDLTLNPLSEGR